MLVLKAFFNKKIKIVFFGYNFQIDLNMSCEGVKEEIKNLLDYNKYEDYVDSFICPTDLKFLKVNFNLFIDTNKDIYIMGVSVYYE